MLRPEISDSDTSCFTYEVSMTVQIFAENEDQAREKVDMEGGHVSRRSVKLVDSVSIYVGNKDEPELSS